MSKSRVWVRVLTMTSMISLCACAEGSEPFYAPFAGDGAVGDGGDNDAGDGDAGTDDDAGGGLSGDGDGAAECAPGQSCGPAGADCAVDADCVYVCGADLKCSVDPQCAAEVDTDADGISDCFEQADGDDWTDPVVFNGVHGRQGDQCSAAGNCAENNTLGKVLSCMDGSVAEELDQSAGWDWAGNPPDSNCDADYGFSPPWTDCNSTWQGDWRGTVHLRAGHHCFELTGGTNESCAALYLDVTTPAESFGGWEAADGATAASTQTDQGAVCFTVAQGNYPIMWHYTMDNGASGSLQLLHCFDAAADCTPSAALPSAMLRLP